MGAGHFKTRTENKRMSYEELKRSLGIPKNQLENGFCAEFFHTVTTFQDRGGTDYSVKMKNTVETLGLPTPDLSHMNPRSSKSYSATGRKGGKRGKRARMSRGKRK